MTADPRLIIFGAGGHGMVVADVATRGGWTVAGFMDDNLVAGAEVGLSASLMGNRSWLCEFPRNTFVVALGIGDNYARRAVAEFLQSKNVEMATIISPSAVVSSSARIGAGTVVMPGAVVNAMATLGEGVIVNTGAIVEHHVEVGDYAHLSPNATLGGASKVGQLAQIAIGASVLPLIRIGDRSILGAGSVATRNIPNDVIAFGVPAQRKRDRTLPEEEKSKLTDF